MANKNYFVHESSYIDQPCSIGDGTKIWHFSHIMKNSVIGENCNIGQNVVIGNNVKIQNNVSVYTGVVCEDNVFLGPSCVFTNVINPRSHISRKNEYRKTILKVGASIGANSTIVCGHVIGKYAFIGAGSVVTKDVPDFTLVVGNPAKPLYNVCQCGKKLSFSNGRAKCPDCGWEYEKDSRGNVMHIEI